VAPVEVAAPTIEERRKKRRNSEAVETALDGEKSKKKQKKDKSQDAEIE